MRLAEIDDVTGMDASTTFQRMKRLQKDGLVTRTGSRWGDPYVLTEAGQALGPVYAAVGRWSAPVPHRASTSAAPPAPTAHREAPTSVGRTAAALGRSPAAPPSLFSHAPQPQPRVPPPSPCVRTGNVYWRRAVVSLLLHSCGRSPVSGSPNYVVGEANSSTRTLGWDLSTCTHASGPYLIGRWGRGAEMKRTTAARPPRSYGRCKLAGGTVTYALKYHRARGKYPDGTLMPGPALKAPGLRLDWDRPDLPLPSRVEEPAPRPETGSEVIYWRCSITPEDRMTVAVARTRHATVLTLSPGLWNSSADNYFTVLRRE
ncbi:hypothetical protein [Streptomyces sp. NPDC057682]|uniref:hypothetical protein n=1 Tax=Streptomyces sp. NPDC057682 TaxID=3346210 RepID=UPI00369BA141